ncbi:MAG: helix-turn-helix transcriptional regulator [Nitrospirae bacterium]|nr:helix-turn-helix transcriptional regulator [Nitrospirota bacterium]
MRSDLDKHIERHLKDKEFKIYFEKAAAKRMIAQEIAALRKASHLTQTQLAKGVGTKQQVISRLESPSDKRMPSFEFLDRIARAFNRRLLISLQR